MSTQEGFNIPANGNEVAGTRTGAEQASTDLIFQRRLQIILMAFVPLAIFCSFLMNFIKDDDLRGLYSDLGSTTLNLIAMSLGILAIMLYPKGEFRKVATFVTIYLALYSVASIIWDIYDQVLKETPFPSIADIPWIASYIPLAFICLTTLIKYHEYSNASRTMFIFIVMFFVAMVVFIPLATAIIGTESTILEKVVTLIYPILDLFLLMLIAQLVSIYWTGKLAAYWTFIMTAIIFEMTADILYTYEENTDIYSAGSLSDSFFFMATFCFIFVFIMVIMARNYNASYSIEPEGRYSIRHVFLVYPNGLLIAHLTTPGTKIIDVEIFTGMLTAVQSFIKESFQLTESAGGGLDRLRYRSLEIAIERGDNVFLAVVVDGRVTDQLHSKMHTVIDQVQEKYGKKLKDWDGDLAHVAGVKDVVGEIFVT